MPYPLRAVGNNFAFLAPDDDCEAAAWALEEYDYAEDFCLGRDFDSEFIARLMAAGFLVMSSFFSMDDEAPQEDDAPFPEEAPPPEESIIILLPRHHLLRSCLFFPELHIKKNIRAKLSRYELRFDTDFDLIVDKCIEVHGSDWLTGPLITAIKEIRNNPGRPVRPVSFGLYRDGALKAGEFGIVAENPRRGSRVYTSYSGYFEEDNAGTVQMILTAQYLEKNGFAFWDLGMPLPYKLTIGAREISRKEFMDHFFGIN